MRNPLILLDLFFDRGSAISWKTALAVACALVNSQLPTKLSTDAVHKRQKRLQNRCLSKSLKVYFKFVGQ
jgi:hypothetical protein